jgi:hypothetical protein
MVRRTIGLIDALPWTLSAWLPQHPGSRRDQSVQGTMPEHVGKSAQLQK